WGGHHRAVTSVTPAPKRNDVPYRCSRNMVPFHPACQRQRRITMQYRTLGRTGVQVSTLALGAMNFGRIGGTTQDEATAIVDAALAAGINLIDTADMYGDGESEEMVGKAI